MKDPKGRRLAVMVIRVGSNLGDDVIEISVSQIGIGGQLSD